MINILTLKQLGFQDHVYFFMLIWFYKILSRSFIFIFVHGCRHTPCHGLCVEVRGQPECWSSSATLFETGCLLFTPACARLADLKASRDSPVSASHCWWECWHYRCVHCHVSICGVLQALTHILTLHTKPFGPLSPLSSPEPASFLTGSCTAQMWQVTFQFLFNSSYFFNFS